MDTGLTNKYVSRLCKKLIGKAFIGTFACDKLMKILPNVLSTRNLYKSISIIINILPRQYRFGHFIGLNVDWEKESFIVFDSLNLRFKDENIEKFILSLKKEVKNLKGYEESVQLQSFSSNYCGFYSVAFVLSRDERSKESMESFLSRFNLAKPSLENDKIAVEYITSFIRLHGIVK